jgi:hypothetical protein
MEQPPEPPRLEIEVQTVTTKTVTEVGIGEDSGLFVSKQVPQPEHDSTAVDEDAAGVGPEPYLQGNNPSDEIQTSSEVGNPVEPLNNSRVVHNDNTAVDPDDGYSFSSTRIEGEPVDPLDSDYSDS